jgi:hypothetical protein
MLRPLKAESLALPRLGGAEPLDARADHVERFIQIGLRVDQRRLDTYHVALAAADAYQHAMLATIAPHLARQSRRRRGMNAPVPCVGY